MPDSLAERIAAAMPQDSNTPRLIVIVGPPGSHKSEALREAADQRGIPVVNLGVELSAALLPLSERDRRLRVRHVLEALIPGRDAVALDNLEILFEPTLRLDPLPTLEALARDRLVIAVWPGHVESGDLVYAYREHPEHKRSKPQSVHVVSAEQEAKEVYE